MVLMSLSVLVATLADGGAGINLSISGGSIVGSVSIWWWVIIVALIFLWHMLGSRRGGLH